MSHLPALSAKGLFSSRCALFGTTFLFVLVAVAVPAASAAEVNSPESHGFSSQRMQRLDAVVQDAVDRKQLAGGIVYLGRNGRTAYLKSYGMSDIEGGKPMSPDAIFRIASMSKAVTAVAVMILYEEGRFLLNDPVSKYLPAFKDPVVAIPPPADGAGKGYLTVPAKNPMTIRQLLTHTAGLTYGDGPAREAYEKANLHGFYFADHDETIGEAINRLATLPLHGQPGEAWQYGFSTDVLGYLVEVVSGQTFDRFLEERLFAPLQMRDTSFFLPLEKVDRLASVYGMENGRLVLKENTRASRYVHGPRKCFSGGAGLLATIGDYARFLQMLLNGGELDGVRVLSPKTVELMHANHTGEKFQLGTNAFGFNFTVLRDLGYHGELGTEGAYSGGGAYSTAYFVDPKENLIGIFMTQLRPAGDLGLHQKFKVLVYQALVK